MDFVLVPLKALFVVRGSLTDASFGFCFLLFFNKRRNTKGGEKNGGGGETRN